MNLPDPKDNQAVYDYVVAHLRKQRVRSMIASELYAGCAYRGANNMTCAVGCLIPDEEYTPKFEGYSIRMPDDDEIQQGLRDLYDAWQIERWARGKGYDLLLLYSLQNLHDSYMRDEEPLPEEFEKQVRTIACDFKLVYKWETYANCNG